MAVETKVDHSYVGDGYEKTHRLEKRLATIDEKYNVFVANKAFWAYFENETTRLHRLSDLVHPHEIGEFEAFIGQSGQERQKVFRFRANNGEYRYNLLRIVSSEKEVFGRQNTNIEMIDIESAVEVNEQIIADVMRDRMLLGITDEYTFSYNRSNNLFQMYRYDQYQRVVIYKMDIDDWKKEMLANGYIAEEDKPMFSTMITDMKSYAQSFSIKIRSSIRTRTQTMETLRFDGILYNGGEDEKSIIGRILPGENYAQQNSTLELMDELHYDSLTGVYNKKAITEYAIRTLKEEKNNRVTIVILDIDHFKSVNDIYGHLYGDKVLTRVGNRLKDVVGEDGVVGRIGGDEFMIVLNGINDNQILRGMLRAIRTQVKWEFADDFEDFMITCSIGASICPNNGRDFEDLFKKADYCLYIAKEKGRDRYVFFRDELHRASYEASVAKKDNGVTNNGREIKELQYISRFMQEAVLHPRDAVRDAMEHMLATYRLDSINIYYGTELRRVYTVGSTLNYSDNAIYVNTQEFKNLLSGKQYVQVGFVGNLMNDAPAFCGEMKRRRVFSTVQCIIGTKDCIQGIVTFDRCKESAQWADYEVNCAVILACYLSVMVSEKNKK